MKKYKVGIIGYFAEGKSKAGGQEAKTWSIYDALSRRIDKDSILTVDTTDWKHRPFKLLFGFIAMVASCDNVIMLPAQKSIKVFIPGAQFINCFFHHRIFYSVVGGWLPKYLKDKPFLKKRSQRLDKIFVETISMKEALESDGFTNIEVIPNFKMIRPVDENSLSFDISSTEQLRICTFSRIMQEKGIEDVINAVKDINTLYKKDVLHLDIIGKIDDNYTARFDTLKQSFPPYIRYKGQVEPHQSIETIKDYFALVFPTHYRTEGIPGTIIDAYMSAVPVITSLWDNHKGVFIENVTGWGYPFADYNALKATLIRLVEHKDEFIRMKRSTLLEAKKYLPENALGILQKHLI